MKPPNSKFTQTIVQGQKPNPATLAKNRAIIRGKEHRARVTGKFVEIAPEREIKRYEWQRSI